MVEDRESRVDFGMAEALAFGTLALHRGVRPPQALQGAQQASAGEDPRSCAQRGTHDQPPDNAIVSWPIRFAEAQGNSGRLLDCPSCFTHIAMPESADEQRLRAIVLLCILHAALHHLALV